MLEPINKTLAVKWIEEGDVVEKESAPKIKDYEWVKVEAPDIKKTAAYEQGARDVFKYIRPFIEKALYDRMFYDYFKELHT